MDKTTTVHDWSLMIELSLVAKGRIWASIVLGTLFHASMVVIGVSGGVELEIA